MSQKSKISEMKERLNGLHSLLEILSTDNKDLKRKLLDVATENRDLKLKMFNLENRLAILEKEKPKLQLEYKIIKKIQDKVQENVTKKVEMVSSSVKKHHESKQKKYKS